MRDPARPRARGLRELIDARQAQPVKRMIYAGPGMSGRALVRDPCSDVTMEAVPLQPAEPGDIVLVAQPDARTPMILGVPLAANGSAAPLVSTPVARARGPLGRAVPLICPVLSVGSPVAVLSAESQIALYTATSSGYGAAAIWQHETPWAQLVNIDRCDLAGDRLVMDVSTASLELAAVNAEGVRTWDTELPSDGSAYTAPPRWGSGAVHLAVVGATGGGAIYRWRPDANATGLAGRRWINLPSDVEAAVGIHLAVVPDGLMLTQGVRLWRYRSGAWGRLADLPDGEGQESRWAGDDLLSLGNGLLYDLRAEGRWRIVEWSVSDWGNVTAANGRLLSFRHDLAGSGSESLLGIAIPGRGKSYSSACTPPLVTMAPVEGLRTAGFFAR